MWARCFNSVVDFLSIATKSQVSGRLMNPCFNSVVDFLSIATEFDVSSVEQLGGFNSVVDFLSIATSSFRSVNESILVSIPSWIFCLLQRFCRGFDTRPYARFNSVVDFLSIATRSSLLAPRW